MHLTEAKATMRSYMREHYTDVDLVRAVDHARAGLLSYYSCCCFAGIPTRQGALHGPAIMHEHFIDGTPFMDLNGGMDASLAFSHFGVDDHQRCRRLIPMLLAEIRRRRAAIAAPVAVEVVSV